MKQIMLQCFQAVRNHFVSKIGFFELYGFDFLVDSEMNVSDRRSSGSQLICSGGGGLGVGGGGRTDKSRRMS